MKVIKIRIGKRQCKVSVIVPARKFEEIKDVLSDLRKQDFKSYEIICVIGKGRIAKAWNLGIKNASGDILLFTESDCRLPTNWIKKMVKAMKKNKGVVFGSEVLVTNRMLSMASFGIHRNVLEKMESKFDESFIIGEDTDFFERLKIQGYELKKEIEPVVFHFKSQDPMKILKWSFIGGMMRVKHWSKYKNPQLNNLKTIFLFRFFYICKEVLAIVGAVVGMFLFLQQIIKKIFKKVKL